MLADTTSVSVLLKSNEVIGPEWSFKTANKLWRNGSIFHMRTCPSMPPVTKIRPVEEIAKALQPKTNISELIILF